MMKVRRDREVYSSTRSQEGPRTPVWVWCFLSRYCWLARCRVHDGSTMSKDRLVKAWINPLAFTEVEFSSPGSSESITAETIVAFLCPPGVSFDAQSLVERYKTISAGPQLFLVPAERRLLDKLVWPLRHAKASYVIGNYLGNVPDAVELEVKRVATPRPCSVVGQGWNQKGGEPPMAKHDRRKTSGQPPSSQPVTIQVPLPVLGVINGVRESFHGLCIATGCRSWRR